MPTLQDLTARLRDVAARCPELSRRPIAVDLGETGVIRAEDGTVANTDGPADCRILLSPDDLGALIEGRLDGMMAYMTGRLRVEGDMGLALQLAQALRSA